MKAHFFNSLISVLLVIVLIPGLIPGIVSAADGQLGDGGNSTNSTLNSNLILENISTDPIHPELNDIVTISALVKNAGDAVSDPTSVIYTIDGVEIRKEVQRIEPGSEAQISHKWTPDKVGTVTITASLEGLENSTKKISVEVVENPLPDLIIERIILEPSEPQERKPLNFTVKVKNQGISPSGEALANYSINGTAGKDIYIPALPAGENTDIKFSLPPDQVKGGPMEVKILVDSGSTVSESNEGNNELTKTVNVKGLLPDLTIESISLNPESPKPGENITFTAIIKNNGPSNASSNELKYTVNGKNETYSGNISVPALVAGETTQGTFSWTPVNEGQIEIKAIVDSRRVISESNETNNEFTKTANVSKEKISDSGGESGSSDSSNSGGGGSSSSSSGGGRSSSSSSSSAGSGTTSKEPASNVDAKELSTRHITSDYHVKFDLVENATCITYIEFDPMKTFKRTTTIVEELKNKSVFVPELPPGRIYKHVNIWVGDKGAGLPGSFKNGVIEFKVKKAWIIENNVSQFHITLQWYDKGWQLLDTKKTREDNDYVYFKTETPGFSCFAITEYKADEKNTQETAGEGKLQETLRNLTNERKEGNLNGSAEKSGLIKNPMGKAKILMAISLPLFMILVEYFILKKKI